MALARHLGDALMEAGYAVDRAGDGARADFLMQTETYDAVVLDLGLPNVDGLTLLARWRQDFAGCHRCARSIRGAA